MADLAQPHIPVKTHGRLFRLLTGVYTWVDQDGNEETETYRWKMRWTLDGIHSYRWKWVHHHGRQACGCTLNPITRRRVLINSECEKHCRSYLMMKTLRDRTDLPDLLEDKDETASQPD